MNQQQNTDESESRTVVGRDVYDDGSLESSTGRTTRVLAGVARPARGDRQPHLGRPPTLVAVPTTHRHPLALVRPQRRPAAVPADVT